MRPANQEAAVGIATACGPREDNQDCALALPEAGIYAVADGMGGLADGRAAAELAVETIRKLATTLRAELKAAISNSTISVAPVLENLFWEVNEAVRSATTERYAPARPPPSGCTLTVAIVVEEFLLIAHVGDSRLALNNG